MTPEEARRHYHRGDPDTSRRAAEQIRLSEQTLQILLAYFEAARPLLDIEAYQWAARTATITGGRQRERLEYYGCQRCSTLRKYGFIVRTGTGINPSGSSAQKCMITVAGLRYLEKIEREAN